MERKGDSKFSFSTWLKDNWLYFLAFAGTVNVNCLFFQRYRTFWRSNVFKK